MLKKILGFAAAFFLAIAISQMPPVLARAEVNGTDIVNAAKTYIGRVPYVWGGTSLDSRGADCSGFICRLYEQFGINMWSCRTHIVDYGTNLGTDYSVAQPGDVIWYSGHVAIFAGWENGNPMVVHCTGGNVQNVTYSNSLNVNAPLRGIIRIPGVVNPAPEPVKEEVPEVKQEPAAPEKAVISSSERTMNNLKLSWNKISGVSGYQLEIAKNKSFKNSKILNIKGDAVTGCIVKVKGIGTRQKLYVRIRAFNTDTKLYGEWSEAAKQ